jgi:hypothetical protein
MASSKALRGPRALVCSRHRVHTLGLVDPALVPLGRRSGRSSKFSHIRSASVPFPIIDKFDIVIDFYQNVKTYVSDRLLGELPYEAHLPSPMP